jgi:hypothetical protein
VGYRLQSGQPIAHEVIRIADRQFELAIAGLHAVDDQEGNTAVHASRRHIKKIRALIRLVRPALGHRYRTVNRRLRAVNRLLAPIADGEATVATLERVAGYGSRLSSDAFAEIHARLLRRRSMANEAAVFDNVLDTAAALLRAERDAVSGWTLGATGVRAIAAGLERTARASRRAMAKATTSSRSRDYHTWRQRVKDQWLQVRLLRERCGEALALDERRLEELDGLLGECHNCAILGEALTSDATLTRTDAARCVRLVRRYERGLRRRARRLGAKIHRESPQRFVARVRRLWRSARRTRHSGKRGTSWRPAA